MDLILIIVTATLVLGWFIYKKLTSKWDTFTGRVPFEKPTLVMGNFERGKSIYETTQQLYDKYYDHK
jgi:hypothetical protein